VQGPDFKPQYNQIKTKQKLLLVAHACNPSYSGGRDQEDCSLKPAWANSSRDPISKIPITKKKKKS
jgi:hypothetical protein